MHIASLLYCLLVVPKEIWIKKDRSNPVFREVDEVQLRNRFHIQLCNDPNFDKAFTFNLLHKIRNSVAHANYDIDESMNFTFRDVYKGIENFRCVVSAADLMWFLSEFGSMLANLRA